MIMRPREVWTELEPEGVVAKEVRFQGGQVMPRWCLLPMWMEAVGADPGVAAASL